MLNFLNPAVLFALTAAAIPLLIHLFNRRKIKRISFSTIHFLKKLEKKQMRNLRIRQLFLLILRTLIIVFLVLAFARPTIKSGTGALLNERTPIEAIIILDNSLSLNEVQMTGTLLKDLRDAFDRLQSIFQAGDRISILQATEPLEELIKQENYQSGVWDRVQQKLQPNYLKSNLDKAILLAIEQLKQSHYYNREIYMISDFQKSGLDIPQIKQFADQVEANNIKFFALPILHHNFENISVDSVEVVNRLVEKNQVLKIQALLSNHDKEKYISTMASALLNGKRVAQQNLNLENGKMHQVLFQLTLTENGYIEGEIQTESDALMEDNRRFFNFYVPPKIRILHILPADNSDSFIPLIIRPPESRGIFEYSKAASVNWSDFNLRDFNVIILEGLREIPSNLIRRLTNFASQGGGVLVIPEANIVMPQYQDLMQELGIGSIIELNGTPGNVDQFLTISQVQWNHTLFEGLFEAPNKQFSPVEVYANYRVKPAPKTETLITLSDGSPFLTLRNIDKGTGVFLSSALKTSWSELPLKGFVVPLTYRLIYYMGTRKLADRQAIKCGESFQQVFTDLEPPYNFGLTGPGESEIKLTPQFKGADVLLRVENIEQPGNYLILQNEQVLSIFSVNPWMEESLMDFYNGDELRNLFKDIFVINDLAQAEETILQSRFGKELWKHLLFLAIVLLLIEMAVARTGSKREFLKAKVGESALKS